MTDIHSTAEYSTTLFSNHLSTLISFRRYWCHMTQFLLCGGILTNSKWEDNTKLADYHADWELKKK